MVEVKPTVNWRFGLACLAVLGWQVGAGMAYPGSSTGPAGEAGLCLALAIWWRDGQNSVGLAAWGATLLSGAVLTGAVPLWMFVIGWPAWLCAHTVLSGGRAKGSLSWLTFVVLSAALVTLCRCAGKLLLQSAPLHLLSTPTLSGFNLLDSFWAEAAPNLGFLLLFGWLLNGWRPRRSEC